MKRAVGIDFTEGIIHRLGQRGFSCRQLTEGPTPGFASYFFPMKDLLGEYDGFEIHIVHDALELRCRDLNEFTRIANPDHLFKFREQSAALIHLGPSCFDLLVTEKE